MLVISLLLSIVIYARLCDGYVNVITTRGSHAFSRALRTTTDDAVEVEKDTAFGIESWRGGYKTSKKEAAEALEGVIPADLEGTYYRNGFGKFESGRVKILHPFDADGMIAAVTMKVISCETIEDCGFHMRCTLLL